MSFLLRNKRMTLWMNKYFCSGKKGVQLPTNDEAVYFVKKTREDLELMKKKLKRLNKEQENLLSDIEKAKSTIDDIERKDKNKRK